jgi:cellulose synthase/poly-beta-1,6-N-acetylglucosamine synthase-like glycosyltransferase
LISESKRSFSVYKLVDLAVALTIGVCAHNEEKNIANLLNNITNQNISSRYEVLLVCSGCVDKTVEIAQAFAEEDPRVRVIVETERLGKPSAINKILANAKGSAIFFVSADTLPNKECLSRLLARLMSSGKVGLVCGKPVPLNKRNSQVDKMTHLLWDFHDRVFSELSQAGQAKHASEIFVIRKDAAVPLPLDTVNDDAYLAVMAKKAGWTVDYEQNAIVFMVGPQNLRDYLIQRRRIIFGHFQLKKNTGENTQYFLFLFFSQPKQAVRLAGWLVAKGSFRILPLFLFVEASLTFLAIFENAYGRSHVLWKTSYSTKKLK